MLVSEWYAVPGSVNYIFSTWIGYSPNYEGEYNVIDFDSASTLSISDDTSDGDVSGLGSYQFSIELKGQYYNGWPHCEIKFNGSLAADFYVETDEWSSIMYGSEGELFFEENLGKK